MFCFLLLCCSTEDIHVEVESSSSEYEDVDSDRPESNVPASVVGEADFSNGEQIHVRSCLTCHPDSAPPFDFFIPQVTDLEIETAIRNGKKGVPAALGERSPPDGALRLNLTDQDIIDVIAFVRYEYGSYEP
jgi:mono/diheme cytochrome c family protein